MRYVKYKLADGKKVKRPGLKHFTEAEIERFMDAVIRHGNIRDNTIFKTLMNTGLRLQELQRLNIEHVANKEFLVVIGKGNKERTVPLTKEMQGVFKSFLGWKASVGESMRYRAPLFLNSRHARRISPRGIRYRVNFYSKKAGMERIFSPHAFRHTLGFRLGKRGVSIRVIQKLLGHSNMNITSIYVEPDMDMLINALEDR
jgi:integrase/recombinase XerD